MWEWNCLQQTSLEGKRWHKVLSHQDNLWPYHFSTPDITKREREQRASSGLKTLTNSLEMIFDDSSNKKRPTLLAQLCQPFHDQMWNRIREKEDNNKYVSIMPRYFRDSVTHKIPPSNIPTNENWNNESLCCLPNFQQTGESEWNLVDSS